MMFGGRVGTGGRHCPWVGHCLPRAGDESGSRCEREDMPPSAGAGVARNGREEKKALSKRAGSQGMRDASSASARAPSALPDALLAGYRAAVEDLVREAAGRPGDLVTAERLVSDRLGQPEFAAVLGGLDGGVDAVAARLADEIRSYRPSTRSSASDLPTF